MAVTAPSRYATAIGKSKASPVISDRAGGMRAAQEKGPALAGPCLHLKIRHHTSVVLAACQEQKRLEDVDEIQIEHQGAIYGFLRRDFIIVARIIHFLDRLRVPRGEARENQNRQNRHGELEPGALQEKID